VVESSSEEEEQEQEQEEEKEEEDSFECDPEDMALFIRKFKKYLNKKKFSKGDKKFNAKSKTKRICYNCSKHGYFIANCRFEHRDDDDDKKRVSSTRRTRVTKKVINITRRSHMSKLTLIKNGISKMRAPTLMMMVWQPLLSKEHPLQANLSSQSSIKKNTLTLWQRRASVR
jgi:hypothetical protein